MRVMMRRSLCLALILLLNTVATVAAHAELVRSDPAPGQRLAQSPSKVTLWFDEELDTSKSTLQIFDVDDRQVDPGDGRVDLDDPDHASMIVTLPPLADGVYIVRWRAVTPDDDGVTEGEFDFLVGNAEARRQPNSAVDPSWLVLAAGSLAALVIITVGIAWRAARR